MSHHVSECHAALCDWAGLAEWQSALQAYLPTYRAASSAATASPAASPAAGAPAAAKPDAVSYTHLTLPTTPYV